MASLHNAPGEPEDVESLGPPGDPDEVARIVCLRLLDRRAYSRAELATAMRKRGVPPEAAERVLDRFTHLALIDDAALADGYALAQHRERGLAARAVAAKLRRRGIDDETVQSAVDQLDRDKEEAAARAIVERRLRSLAGLEPAVQIRRLAGVLARKGYAPGLVNQVVRAAVPASRGSRDDDWELGELEGSDGTDD